LIRSFLLLEDDYSVDWEVDQDERSGDIGSADGPFSSGPSREWRPWKAIDREHPHRRAVRIERRGRGRKRRPGSVEAREVCSCPLPPTPTRRPSTSTPANQSRQSTTTAGRPVGGPRV
jgi:hypothetical protein